MNDDPYADVIAEQWDRLDVVKASKDDQIKDKDADNQKI